MPYSISSDVILWLIKERLSVKCASLLMQAEFAERISAGPGSKKYGSLSVLRGLYAEADLGPRVKGTAFHPRANVDSLCIKLRFLEEPRCEVHDEAFFEKTVRACFAQRRKKVINSLSSASFIPNKELVADVFSVLEIDDSRRAETLSVHEYALISNLLLTNLNPESRPN